MRTVLLKNNVMGLAFILGCAPVAWGAIGSCPATVEQMLNATVVGTGQGCSYLNANFDNFSVSAATGANASFPATTGTNGGSTESANIEFAPSGTPMYTLDFQTVAQNVTSTSTIPCIANTWCVLENGTPLTATQSFTYGAVATTGGFYGLALTDGTLQTHILVPGDVITTMEAFCLGTSTFTCSTSGGTYGYLEVQQTESASQVFVATYTVCRPGATTCVLESNPGSAYINFAGTTAIGIQNSVTIYEPATGGAGTLPAFIDSFDNDFYTTPEPGSFMLMGSALAGLCLFLLLKGRP